MDGTTAIGKILKAEGIEFVTWFPDNLGVEGAAAQGIRSIRTRTERVAVGIADGYTRASFGHHHGVVFVQFGPGSENAFAGIAQAYADSVPILFMPGGYKRRDLKRPQFIAQNNYRGVSKSIDIAHFADQIPTLMRRAFVYLKTGRPGPVILEIPLDVFTEEFDDALFQYEPIKGWKPAGDPSDIKRTAKALINAETPVIRAGNGVLHADACNELRELAELLQIPVYTTMQGKSAFPENHPLALGCGGVTRPKMVVHFQNKADLVFAIGSSCTTENYTTPIPAGTPIIQSTIDEVDISKDYPISDAVIGDAKLVLQQLIDEVRKVLGPSGKKSGNGVAKEIQAVKDEWLKEWMPKLTSDEIPINPNRVVWELNNILDKNKSIVTAEAGSPRNISVTFYQPTTPGGFIGWGKTTTLGGSLGFAMGAKMANPDKTVVAIMGDAGIGMAGLDFETSTRERIPILCIILNNQELSGVQAVHPTATKLYNAAYAGGDYVKIAEAVGFHAERVDKPEGIAPAIERAKKVVTNGQSALIDIIGRMDMDFCSYKELLR